MFYTHPIEDYENSQKAIDRITPAMFEAFKKEGAYGDEPAFRAYKESLAKVMAEAEGTEDVPAAWLVYNNGYLMKSGELLFSLDISHPDLVDYVSKLDFAMITHNHEDHYQAAFYQKMNEELHKTVINNFEANTGAFGPQSFGGGYTRGGKTFEFGDVEIITAKVDHNPYLIDYTTSYEIHMGGLVLFHSGDCGSVGKLNPTVQPDIWIVHPYCGMDVVDGYKKFQPKLTVIGHMNEMTHPIDKWRWTWENGFEAARAIEALGGKAVVPMWGDRVL